MNMNDANLTKQLDELQMIQCSLMQGERLEFVDDPGNFWKERLDSHESGSEGSSESPGSPAHLRILIDDAQCYVNVLVNAEYDGTLETSKHFMLDLKGDNVDRAGQRRWQNLFQEKLAELDDTEYPLYQLLCTHVLPPLHEELESLNESSEEAFQERTTESPTIYHALLTSHHLISPNKRRSLQNWSSSLKISGFAKVGYPGVIYGTGERENIEEFVANIKAMQWLALRVRFVEPLPGTLLQSLPERSWMEFQKVGEVVEEMRKLGREQYVVEMGIGSAGEKGQEL